jgi:hypothetical protein
MNPCDRVRLQHLADAPNSAIRFAQDRRRGDLDDMLVEFSERGRCSPLRRGGAASDARAELNI